MEIEAKFVLSSRESFQRLLTAETLSGFSLGAVRAKRVHDAYLDTADRLILAAGYSCRRREQPDGILITLKGLRRGEGAIYRREEWEVQLAEYNPPEEWPDSPVRDRVLRLIGDAPLGQLFDLEQMRHVRPLHASDRLVAEMSLDDVHIAVGTRELSYFELEAELTREGTEEDLLAVVTCLRNEWGLQPESRSKFERALIFVGDALTQGHLLTAEERVTCTRIAARKDLHGRRAAALLALDDGASQETAGRTAGMSERRVRHWLAMFRNKRLKVFSERVLAATSSRPEEATETSDWGAMLDSSGDHRPQPWPMRLLISRYKVDQTHARAVADLAVSLFDHLLPIHRLPVDRRGLLETAAMVHDVGLTSGPKHQNIAGYDILQRHPPVGLNDQERQVVALTTLLQSSQLHDGGIARLTRERLADLPAETQSEVMTLAALVRMADGLDYSQGNSQLGRAEHLTGEVTIEVVGPFALVDAERAGEKSDLWNSLFDAEVRFYPAGVAPSVTEARVPPSSVEAVEPVEVGAPTGETPVPQLPSAPGIEADDSMAEAARKTLLFHLQRMLAHEAGTRLGEDPEELHDMRVATRRMRAAIPVFEDYLDMEQMTPFVKGMRRTGRALGAVRDLDVFFEKIRRYLDALPPERQGELDALLAVWTRQRDWAREEMLSYLNSDRYAHFVQRFGEFLQTPGAGARPTLSEQGPPVPHRVRHIVPITLYRRLAEVRAYGEWLTGADVPLGRYHQLRIASKGLRYTLEFFREVLGPQAKDLIGEVKGLQDLLGDLNDAVVACNLLRDFLTWGTWGHDPERASFTSSMIVSPGAAAYLACRQAELQQLIQAFPNTWERFHSAQFSQWTAQAVAAIR